MDNESKKLIDGADCPSKCGGFVYWRGYRRMFVCLNCSKSYDKIAPVPETPAHVRPIAYIAGALNDMSCAYLSNVRKMILWAEKIRELGYAVFIPGIDLLCGIACEDWSYDVCFNNSQPFLAKADIVFVCPGWENSKGTKRELETAKNLSVPVYYGDDGYAELNSKLEDAEWVTLAEKPSDEESARDRRRPKDVHTIAGDLDAETLAELDAEALAELERRVAESPFRNTAKTAVCLPFRSRVNEISKKHTDRASENVEQYIKGMVDKSRKSLPYIHVDEGTCDEHIGPGVASEYAPGTKTQSMSDFLSGAAQNKKLKFIEEANNHNIMGYLKHDPHPDYRIVSVIPMPLSPRGTGAARFHTYIWELKDA